MGKRRWYRKKKIILNLFLFGICYSIIMYLC
jgi:hypothetical protein